MYKGMCMYIHRMNVYMQCMYMVNTGFNQLFRVQQETDDRLGRRQLSGWRKGPWSLHWAETRLRCQPWRLIGPDEKWSVVVELYSLRLTRRRVCTMYSGYIHIFTIINIMMYVQCTYRHPLWHNFTFINMYVHSTTYIYIYSCKRSRCNVLVFVCTWYTTSKHVCTSDVSELVQNEGKTIRAYNYISGLYAL